MTTEQLFCANGKSTSINTVNHKFKNVTIEIGDTITTYVKGKLETGVVTAANDFYKGVPVVDIQGESWGLLSGFVYLRQVLSITKPMQDVYNGQSIEPGDSVTAIVAGKSVTGVVTKVGLRNGEHLITFLVAGRFAFTVYLTQITHHTKK